MLELGDDAATALGVPAERTRLAAVIVGVGLTAAVTAAAGLAWLLSAQWRKGQG